MGSLSVTNARGGLTVSSRNARYLADAYGKPLYLVGFHTWYNVQDGGGSDPPTALNWNEYLTALLEHGCNATKLWSMESGRGWSDDTDQWFDPVQFARTGPGNDNDGKLKFDVTKVNPAYLRRLYERTAECAARNVYVVVQLFQGWQNELNKGGTGDPCSYHPMLAANNINSVDGDFNDDGSLLEIHTDTNNAAWSYQQTFVTAVVNLLNNFDNVIYEISNEDTGSTANTNWQEAVIDHIETTEASLPKQHLIMRTVAYPNGSDTALNSSGATVVSYRPDTADTTVSGTKVSIYDTDHTFGITDTYSWIWQSLCNGHGGAFYMDEWDGALYGTDRRNSATYQLIRDNLGYALTMAKRPADLLAMTPQPTLSTTNYCLAKNHATDADYIVFQDGTGAFQLNLTTASGTLNIHWLRCSDGSTSTDTVAGGAARSLTPPWAGKVVAHVYH